MAEVTKLTVQDLLNFYSTFRAAPEVREKPALAMVVMGLHVVKHFLGEPWIKAHLDPFLKRQGFMRIALDQTAQAEIQAFRLVDLGELLLNLQNIDGFGDLIERMRTGDVESNVGELHVGRLLYINDVAFRFVVPSGKEGGDNFDLEITYPDGLTACGETKCKIESTQIGANTITSTLSRARDQLPKDRPGIIFMKVPQHWLEDEDGPRTMVEAGTSFLRNTTRVVSVKFYTEPLTYADGTLSQGHRFKELSNPNNKFDAARDWNLLRYRPKGDQWDALPEKWIRLVNFPDELRQHANV